MQCKCNIEKLRYDWANLEMDACFVTFDKDRDGKLNFDEFKSLCRSLFRGPNGENHPLHGETLRELFSIFDYHPDGFIDRIEWNYIWHKWIKVIARPVTALLVVDVQNDFISGNLNISKCTAKQNGDEVIEPINNLLNTNNFDVVYYSYDWHPSDHVSFIDNVNLRPLHQSSPVTAEDAQVYDTVIFDTTPPMEQTLWPSHCVQNTWGAELHPELKVLENSVKLYKGTNPEVDSYSLFWDNMKLTDTKLDAQLKKKNVTDVFVCGLAYDVCVAATAKDALSAGYRTILIDDCCRGVDMLDIAKTKTYIKDNHGIVVNSDEVKALVEGTDRRVELAYKLALELKKCKCHPECKEKHDHHHNQSHQ